MLCYCCSDCANMPGFNCCGIAIVYFTFMFNNDGVTNRYHPCGCTCFFAHNYNYINGVEISLLPCISIMK